MTANEVPSAAERAYEAVRAGILDGTYVLGARLPEEEVAARVGVSRTPVREALRRLAAEGFVRFAPNRGAQVETWTDADLEDIFDLRALLESHGARRAATRIGADDLALLGTLADAMEAAAAEATPAALDDIAACNSRFHRTVLLAADSDRLLATLGTVIVMPLVHRTFHRYTPAALRRSMQHHRELLAALQVGDGEWAAGVMRVHVLAAKAVLLAHQRGRAEAEVTS